MRELVFILLLTACVMGVQSAGECGEAQRTSSLTNCLNLMKNKMGDANLFWFGNRFTSICKGDDNDDPLDCNRSFLLQQPPRSLQSMLIPTTEASFPNVNTYLSIKYMAKKSDSNSGCDTKVEVDDMQFEVDPLSDEVYTALELKNMPSFSWNTGQLDDSSKMVLLAAEAPSGRLLALYANVPFSDGKLDSSNIGSTTVVQAYQPPMVLVSQPIPVVFLMLLQSRDLTDIPLSTTSVFTKKKDFYFVNIDQLKQSFGLNGPYAMNWVLAKRDAYSADSRNNGGLGDSCAALVQEAVGRQGRPWLPNNQPLSVFLSVTFNAQEVKVSFCCKEHVFPTMTTVLDPIMDGSTKAAFVRSAEGGTKRTIAVNRRKFLPDASQDFTGKIYTIIMVDPDVPRPTAGTNELPLVHWIVINMDGVVDEEQGEVLVTYGGPMPPDDLPHGYYIMLYEQTGGRLYDVNVTMYVSGGSRFLFNVARFVTDHQLNLMGASWMFVRNDEFVNSLNKDRGRLDEAREDSLCSEVQGYGRPCPPSPASRPGPALIWFSGAFILVMRMNL